LAWWAWERGAYFGVNFLPGAMVLLVLVGALLLWAPWPAVLRGPAAVALGGLLALAGWTLLSTLWSPARDIAVEDGQRVLMYALAFGLGLWLSLLLGRRMLLALTPVVAAGAVVAVLTTIALWLGDDPGELLETDATLRFPLGYRNANAAFFIAALLPTVVLAAGREHDWRLRGALIGAGTLMLELAVLAQSRGSVFAAAIAVTILVAVHPARLRVLAWLAIATIPAMVALPWVLEVYQHGGGNTAESLAPLESAAAAMALTAASSAAIGCVVARGEPIVTLSPSAGRAIGWGLAAVLAAGVLAGMVALATTEGGPGGFINRQADELTAGSPDLSEQGSRFGLDLRSERGDLWGVALDDLVANPVAGEGAGGFRFSYLLERDTALQPEDPHSVEMLMASELGLPGLLLFGCFIGGAVIAVLRARRLGPSAAALAAGSLALGGYWLVHASVEWFWSYPALTLPVAYALGAACAPGLLRPEGEISIRWRRGLAVAATLVALSLVPFFASERYTNNALRNWQGDLANAYSELDLAADLNPFSDRPLATEAVIAEEAGEPQRALAALSEAQSRQPEEWTLYYLEARVLAEFDSAGAQRALAQAKALNPAGPEIAELEEGIASGQAP